MNSGRTMVEGLESRQFLSAAPTPVSHLDFKQPASVRVPLRAAAGIVANPAMVGDYVGMYQLTTGADQGTVAFKITSTKGKTVSGVYDFVSGDGTEWKHSFKSTITRGDHFKLRITARGTSVAGDVTWVYSSSDSHGIYGLFKGAKWGGLKLGRYGLVAFTATTPFSFSY